MTLRTFKVISALLLISATANFSNISCAQSTAPTITSPLTASAVQNVPFVYTATATGTAPLSFSITGLPLGLDLVGNTIVGTPLTFGTFVMTLSAFNAFGIDSQQVRLQIASAQEGQRPIITNAGTLSVSQGVLVDFPITVQGATPISVFVTGLPPGLTFNGQNISGIPSVSGNFTSTVTASNASGTAFQALSISVLPGFPTAAVPPNITSPQTANGLTGQPFSYVVTTEGTIPVTITALGLPIGLTLAGNTISGFPVTAGIFSVAITATNAAGSQTKQVGFNILQSGIVPIGRPIITSPNSVTGIVGTPFSLQLTASGQSPINFTTSILPPGLALEGTTIAGVPAQSGTFTATVTATNINGATSQIIVFNIQPTVTPPSNVAPSITSPPNASGLLNQPFIFTLTATGALPISFTSTALPQGLTLASNGVISGTPLQSGNFSVEVTATNIFGTQSQSLLITILTSTVGRPVLTIPFTASAIVGQLFTLTLTASGTQPITFTAIGLPPGLELIGDTITGSPQIPGTFFVTINAVNSFGAATQMLTLTVTANFPPTAITPPVVVSPVVAVGEVGRAFVFPILTTGGIPTTISTTELPPGLALVADIITGIPELAGSTQVLITASNSAGSSNQAILITINPPSRVLPIGFTPIVVLGGTAAGVVGQSFVLPLTTTTTTTSTPVAFSTIGLPAGLVVSDNTIVGTPQVAGTFPVTVTAATELGTASQTLLLAIAASPVSQLNIGSMKILLDLDSQDEDAIRLQGTLMVDNGFAAGQIATIDVGGVVRSFTFGRNGAARSGGDSMKLKIRRKSETATLTVSLTHGNFAGALTQFGLNNTATNATPVTVPVQFTLGASTTSTTVTLILNTQKAHPERLTFKQAK